MKKYLSIGVMAGGVLIAAIAFADVTAALLPIANGTYSQWSGNYTRIDESNCNGNTDYNLTNLVGRRASYIIDLSSIPNESIITQITVYPCASQYKNGVASSQINVFYRFNGANSADAGNYLLSGTIPVELSATAFGGLSLVKQSYNSLEIGAVYSSGSKGVKLSRLAAQITYTLPATPTAPSNLTATQSSTTTDAVLNWQDNSTNEGGFKIERGVDGVNFLEINSVTANVIQYTDPNLSIGTYYYRVKAFNAGGNSDYSNIANVTIQ